MQKIIDYISFIEEKGISLKEINPGSKEFALKAEDILSVIHLLHGTKTPILGGDVLSKDSSDKLAYAIHLWGSDYHYLNWYCEKMDNESYEEYVNRSHQEAEKNIETANNIAKSLNKSCYIVIVISKED